MVCETVKSILPCKSVCTCGITTPSGESPAELEPPRVGAGLWPTAYRRQNAHYQRNGAEKPQPNTVQYTNYNAVNDDMNMQFGRWETEIQTHTQTHRHTHRHTHTQRHIQRHRHKTSTPVNLTSSSSAFSPLEESEYFALAEAGGWDD